MVRVQLDPKGRLSRFDVRPWTEATSTPAVNPTSLFAAADLDSTRFSAAEPREIPLTSFDTRQAWIGSYAADRLERVRVEAAFWRGRPVFLSIAPEERLSDAAELLPIGGVPQLVFLILSIFIIASLATAALMAWHHLRHGRTDFRGAAGLGATAFVAYMASWLLTAEHVSSLREIDLLFTALGGATFTAMLLWLFYVAIEPHVRRNWPDALISWTRIGRGDVRNAWSLRTSWPAGSVFEHVVLPGGRLLVSASFNTDVSAVLSGTSQNLGVLFQSFIGWQILALTFLVVVVVLRFATRRLWIADVVGSVLLFGPLGLNTFTGDTRLQAVAGFVVLAVVAFVWMQLLRRFGFLTVLTIFCVGIVRTMPFTLTGWLAARPIALHLIPIALAAACLWAILTAERRPAIESPA